MNKLVFTFFSAAIISGQAFAIDGGDHGGHYDGPNCKIELHYKYAENCGEYEPSQDLVQSAASDESREIEAYVPSFKKCFYLIKKHLSEPYENTVTYCPIYAKFKYHGEDFKLVKGVVVKGEETNGEPEPEPTQDLN